MVFVSRESLHYYQETFDESLLLDTSPATKYPSLSDKKTRITLRFTYSLLHFALFLKKTSSFYTFKKQVFSIWYGCFFWGLFVQVPNTRFLMFLQISNCPYVHVKAEKVAARDGRTRLRCSWPPCSWVIACGACTRGAHVAVTQLQGR